ncbi:MAG: hypothetical protein ABH851_09055 [Methanobacteriota archaeon]
MHRYMPPGGSKGSISMDFNEESPLIAGYILSNTFSELDLPSPIPARAETLGDGITGWDDVKAKLAPLTDPQKSAVIGFSMALVFMGQDSYRSEGAKVLKLALDCLDRQGPSNTPIVSPAKPPSKFSETPFPAGLKEVLIELGGQIANWMVVEDIPNPYDGIENPMQLFGRLNTQNSDTLGYMRGFTKLVEIHGNQNQKQVAGMVLSSCREIMGARQES